MAPPAVSNNPEVARPSDYLSAPRVTYPYEARKRRQEGSVLLLVEFNEDGLPVRVEVEQSSGIALLDSTARQHVNRTFRFKPGSSRTVLVPITFSLK
jgi:protein TonB